MARIAAQPDSGAAQARHEVRVLTVRIGAPGGEPGEIPVFKLTQGDDVTIRATSAQGGVLMIHGYTPTGIPVAQAQPATVVFAAVHAGH